MNSLVLENLSKTFEGGAQALRNFSLEIKEGELIAIVGPSGCGKSTLLRIIAGLEEQTSGTVSMGHRILDGLPPRMRDIAVVFQSYTLMPNLTVYENLGFGLALRGEPRSGREGKIRDAARLLGLESLLNRFPAEISGGERQRVALGRAILREPQVFLFDEPLSSLDAQMRFQLRIEIQRLHRRLRTPMLFVTHDQNEALNLGDRVVVLHQGLIQQIATPEELHLHPANIFVASFIGSPGMNLFPGRIEISDGAAHFRSSAFEVSLSPAMVEKLQGCAEVTMGIRPENLLLADDKGLFGGRVVAVEKLWGQTCVYVQNGEVSLAVKMQFEAAPGVGDQVCLNFSLSDIVFFDTKTGFAFPFFRSSK